MHQLHALADRGRETRRYRGVLYSCQGVVALMLVGLLLPAPGSIAMIAIAGAGLMLMGLQHFISRRLGDKSVDLIRNHEELLVDAEASRHRTEELFEMTDMLQSAEDHRDAGEVLQATSLRLLPDFSGALYVFNNSRDRLDLAVDWSPKTPSSQSGFEPAEALVPDNC